LSNEKKLIAISAPSGTGKTSIIQEILKLNQNKLIFSISATTREKRLNEIDGVDYFFLTREEFEHKIQNDKFIEWEEIYGDYYGTLKSEIERAKKLNKHILFELDVNGSLKLKKLYPQTITIFIAPPSIEELENRLKTRKTETSESLHKRIERAKIEMEKAKLFDFLVMNDNLNNAISEVNQIIQKTIEDC